MGAAAGPRPARPARGRGCAAGGRHFLHWDGGEGSTGPSAFVWGVGVECESVACVWGEKGFENRRTVVALSIHAWHCMHATCPRHTKPTLHRSKNPVTGAEMDVARRATSEQAGKQVHSGRESGDSASSQRRAKRPFFEGARALRPPAAALLAIRTLFLCKTNTVLHDQDGGAWTCASGTARAGQTTSARQATANTPRSPFRGSF